MNGRRCYVALALGAALLVAAGCRSGPAPAEPGAWAQEATATRGAIADVVQVAGQVVALNSRNLAFGTVGGQVLEVMVRPGSRVEKGQALARISTAGPERELREAQADLKVAEAGLADARRVATEAEMARAEAAVATADAALAEATVELAAAQAAGIAPLEAAVADAEYALQVARDELRQQELSANQAQIRRLEYDLAFYQRSLRDARTGEEKAQAQENLDRIEPDLAGARAARDDALRAAREQVTEKEEDLAGAQATLARARAGEEDPAAAADLAYEKAAADAEKAHQTLAEFQMGQESPSVKAAKTTYDAALAKVETAQAAIASSTLRAPFVGIVWAVFVAPDDWVEPSTEVVYLADPTDLRVRAQASEMDVTRLAVGQKVRLTFDAFPGKVFAGEVLSMPLQGEQAAGMSVYEIETSLEQEGNDVRAGMLANVRFVVGEKADVLTIPAAAVQYRAGNQTYVSLRGADGKVREQVVSIGLDDGIMAEVLEGLSEGQTVLVPLVQPMQPGSFGGMVQPVPAAPAVVE